MKAPESIDELKDFLSRLSLNGPDLYRYNDVSPSLRLLAALSNHAQVRILALALLVGDRDAQNVAHALMPKLGVQAKSLGNLLQLLSDTNRKQTLAEASAIAAMSLEGENTGYRFLYFRIHSMLFEYIALRIQESQPSRVLVAEGAVIREKIADDLRTLFPQYRILENEGCSLSWLCKTVAAIRQGEDKAILLTNYPKESTPPSTRFTRYPEGKTQTVRMPDGTSLQLVDKADPETAVHVYLIGLHATEYCDSLYASQADGRANLTAMEVLVPNTDRYLTNQDFSDLEGTTPEHWEFILRRAAIDLNQTKGVGYEGSILIE